LDSTPALPSCPRYRCCAEIPQIPHSTAAAVAVTDLFRQNHPHHGKCMFCRKHSREVGFHAQQQLGKYQNTEYCHLEKKLPFPDGTWLHPNPLHPPVEPQNSSTLMEAPGKCFGIFRDNFAVFVDVWNGGGLRCSFIQRPRVTVIAAGGGDALRRRIRDRRKQTPARVRTCRNTTSTTSDIKATQSSTCRAEEDRRE